MRGGRRPGAGRPRKSAEDKALGGWAGKRGTQAEQHAALEHEVKQQKARADAPPLPVPIDLSAEQAAIWAELAPHATAQGTLTTASTFAFRELCEAITVKRQLLAQILREGWTVGDSEKPRAHPLLTRYQGIYQRVEAGLTRFALAPMGEEMNFGGPPPAKPTDADPFAEFDDATGTH